MNSLWLLAVAAVVATVVAVPFPHDDDEDGSKWYDDDMTAIQFDGKLQFLLDMYQEAIPHSYSIPATYFREELYIRSGLHPHPLDGKDAIQDRINSYYGLNLYDAGTWEIALALRNEWELQQVYENQILYGSTTGRVDNVGGLKDIRADTDDFEYGPDKTIGSSLDKVKMPGNASNPNTKGGEDHTIPGAFFYRMVAPCYMCEDPLIGAYAESYRYNETKDKGKGPSWNTEGVIVWNDWKPITGEQAWATMIGPLNYLFLKYNGSIPMFSTFEEAPGQVQLGMSILPALKAMVTPLGGFYHCPKGTDMYPADEDESSNVSNENNFSAYAALRMLQYLLANNTKGGGDSYLSQAKSDVDDMVEAMEKWFDTGLFAKVDTGNMVVYQGGHVSFGGQYDPVGIMDYSGFAVDCQTWGATVLVSYLGIDWLDGKIGEGGGYQMWQETKNRAGHFVNGSIAGVGFTQVFNKTDNTTMHEVFSAEWSYGAMLMCRTLADAYEKVGKQQYADDLRSDVELMEAAVATEFEYGGLHNSEDGGMMYANTRFFIPWGWYANPVSSLCSTSWSVMNEKHFNPFVLGGYLNHTTTTEQYYTAVSH
jgi:hypothetical protein